MIKFDKVIIFPIVNFQRTFYEKNQKTEFPLSIKRFIVADADEDDNVILKTSGVGGNKAPQTVRFSVKDSNGASLRSTSGGRREGPRKMGEYERVKKLITMEGKGVGGNGTLRTASRGGNRAPSTMWFSFKVRNIASHRSASRGGSGVPRMMGQCEGIKKRISVE